MFGSTSKDKKEKKEKERREDDDKKEKKKASASKDGEGSLIVFSNPLLGKSKELQVLRSSGNSPSRSRASSTESRSRSGSIDPSSISSTPSESQGAASPRGSTSSLSVKETLLPRRNTNTLLSASRPRSSSLSGPPPPVVRQHSVGAMSLAVPLSAIGPGSANATRSSLSHSSSTDLHGHSSLASRSAKVSVEDESEASSSASSLRSRGGSRIGGSHVARNPLSQQLDLIRQTQLQDSASKVWTTSAETLPGSKIKRVSDEDYHRAAGRHALVLRRTRSQFQLLRFKPKQLHLRRVQSLQFMKDRVNGVAWLLEEEFLQHNRNAVEPAAAPAGKAPAAPAVDAPIAYQEIDGKKLIISASVTQLLDIFAGDNVDAIPDNNLLSAFLMSHKYFIDSLKLLELFCDRYKKPPGANDATKDAVRIRVIKVLKKWIDESFLGFKTDTRLVEFFTRWAATASALSAKDKGWIDHLVQSLKREPPREETASLCPTPRLPIGTKPSKAPVLDDIDTLEVARQLTLLHHALFTTIRYEDVYRCAWAKKSKAPPGAQAQAPTNSLLKLTERFNRISYWVAAEIVTTLQLEARVCVLARFIQIAEHLLQLNNFDCVMAIYCALNMGSIQRLKCTWKLLPEKFLKKMKAIDQLLDCANNFKRYREALARCTPPTLPLQAVLLSDLTQSEEIPDWLSGGHANVEKMRVLSKTYQSMQSWQQTPYLFTEVPFITEMLQSSALPYKDEEELYRLSKACSEAAANTTVNTSKLKRIAAGQLNGIRSCEEFKTTESSKEKDDKKKVEKIKAEEKTRRNSFSN